jgi:hypothetical protein
MSDSDTSNSLCNTECSYYCECEAGLEDIINQLDISHALLRSFSKSIAPNTMLVPIEGGAELWREYGLEIPSSMDDVLDALRRVSAQDIEENNRVTFGERLIKILKASSFEVFES